MLWYVQASPPLPAVIWTGYVGEKPWVNKSSDRACTTMGTQETYWHIRHAESDWYRASSKTRLGRSSSRNVTQHGLSSVFILHVKQSLLLSRSRKQIEYNEISARISANGTVTFSDPPPTFTRSRVDDLLRSVQTQAALLSQLDLDLGKSREYLAKVVRLKDDSWGAAEEILFTSEEGQERSGVWVEDPTYTVWRDGTRAVDARNVCNFTIHSMTMFPQLNDWFPESRRTGWKISTWYPHPYYPLYRDESHLPAETQHTLILDYVLIELQPSHSCPKLSHGSDWLHKRSWMGFKASARARRFSSFFFFVNNLLHGARG